MHPTCIPACLQGTPTAPQCACRAPHSALQRAYRSPSSSSRHPGLVPKSFPILSLEALLLGCDLAWPTSCRSGPSSRSVSYVFVSGSSRLWVSDCATSSLSFLGVLDFGSRTALPLRLLLPLPPGCSCRRASRSSASRLSSWVAIWLGLLLVEAGLHPVP